MKTKTKKTKLFKAVCVKGEWRVVRKGSKEYAPFAGTTHFTRRIAEHAADMCNASGSWWGYGTLSD